MEPSPRARTGPGVVLDRLLSSRSVVTVVTLSLVLASLGLSVLWVLRPDSGDRLEPVVGALGFAGAVVGILGERRISRAEERRRERMRRWETLAGLRRELTENLGVLDRHPFTAGSQPPRRRGAYPRLFVSAIDATLSSPTLMVDPADRALVEDLHFLRNKMATFDHQLSLAELVSFVDPDVNALHDIHRGLHKPGGTLSVVRERIETLLTRLPESPAEQTDP